MHKSQICYRTRSDITAFSLLESGAFAFSTKVHGAKIFSASECSSIKNLSIEQLNYRTTAVAFSKSSELLALANGTTIHIINTQNKLLIQTIRTYEGTIEKIEFIPQSKYLVTGTANGRVMQYRYDGRSGLSRLCSFGQKSSKREEKKRNFISAFAFYNGILAVSGYGGIITILRMNTYTKRYTIEGTKARINALCFLDDSQIISGNNDGDITIHSLRKYIPAKTITTPFRDINSIVLMPNKNFIMVSGASRKLLLIDIQKAKIVATNYLTFEHNISHLALTNTNKLLVVLESRQIARVKLPSAQDIKEFLLHNELDKAYAIIDKDPMLQGTREHKRVEVLYEKLYEQAVSALIDSNTKEARKLMQMFSSVSSKKSDITSIFRAFEYYPRFVSLYLEKKYALAYAIAEKFPALKRTQQYKKMDETFKEAFTFAQKQILLERVDLAKDILAPYVTVLSKKPLINLILKHNEEFISFLQAVNEKDFETIDTLIKRNAILGEIPNYLALKSEIQTTLTNIEKFIASGEWSGAISLIKEYSRIPHIQNDLQRFYRDALLIKRLQESYAQSDFIRCYEILDSCDTLHHLELAELLEKHWSKLINTTEEFALKGDLKSIKKSFGELLSVETRSDKIGDILRLSFTTKIKALTANKSYKNAQAIIYSYIDIFGLDSEMQLIMRSFEKVTQKKLAITQNQDKRLPRDNWKNSSLIMN